jgi:hypothetical protein
MGRWVAIKDTCQFIPCVSGTVVENREQKAPLAAESLLQPFPDAVGFGFGLLSLLLAKFL